MSATIDERVVEMRFDNKQFEKGAKESMGTLTKLKQSLDLSGASKSLDELDKAAKSFDLSNIDRNLQQLNNRFSFFGRAWMETVDNVRRKFTRDIGSVISFVTSSINSGGLRRSMNIENAHFQLQALLKDEAKVQQIMDNAMKSVDGTAYAYDEAARAASQFAASGVKGGEQMQKALNAIADVSASVNADYSGLALIFTQIAGKGRLMGDEIMQLSQRGMNAAATLAKYYREVRGEIGTTEAEIREMASKGKISFQDFIDAMEYAYSGSAARANETFNGAFANMKSALARIGAEFYSPLIEQNSEVVGLFNALREKINEVKAAIAFKGYDSKGFKSVVVQMSEAVLRLASKTKDLVKNAKLDKFLLSTQIAGKGVVNIFRGIGTVLKPIKDGFDNIFGNFNMDGLLKLTIKFEQFTRKMKLSAEGTKNLQDTVSGLMSIFRSLGLIVSKIIAGINPTGSGLNSILEIILKLTGIMGRFALSVTEAIDSNTVLTSILHGLGSAIGIVISWISSLLDMLSNITVKNNNFKESTEGIRESFKKFWEYVKPSLEVMGEKLKGFAEILAGLAAAGIISGLNTLASVLDKISNGVIHIDNSKSLSFLSKFTGAIERLGYGKSNESLTSFTSNLKDFATNVKDAFSSDSMIGNVNNTKNTIGNFIGWLRTYVMPLFKDVSAGGVLASGSGLAMIYSLVKMTKSFETIAKAFANLAISGANFIRIFDRIPAILSNVSGVLIAYQKNIKADTILKIAKAIGILTISIIALSFIPTEKLLAATGVLATGGAVLVGAMGLWYKASSIAETTNLKLTKVLDNAIKGFNKARMVKATGKFVKDFAAAILMVAGAIIALGIFYQKNKEGFKAGAIIVGVITTVLIGIAALGVLVANKFSKAATNFMKVSVATVAVSAALFIMVSALKSIMKLTIPEDWATKLLLLGGLIAGVAALVLTVALAGKIADGSVLKIGGTMIAIAIMLKTLVSALGALFSMYLPPDWKTKRDILIGMIILLQALILTIGVTAKLAGGKLKAASTILAMCMAIITIVGALIVLQLFPAKALMKGAVALGGVLLTLGAALYAAGKITTPHTWKSVMAMAVVTASIVTALAVLSMVPMNKLLKASASLGVVLLSIAQVFKGVGKIQNDSAFKSILGMIAILVTITASLFVLSLRPWQQLTAAAVAMGVTLLAFAKSMSVLSGKSGLYGVNKAGVNKINQVLKMTLIMIPIAAALSVMANQPWQGMLAATIAMSATLLAFCKVMDEVSGDSGLYGVNKGGVNKINQVLKLSLLMIPIAATLSIMAHQPWDGMLAATIAMSVTLLAFAKSFEIISKIKTKDQSILSILPGILAMVTICATLSIMAHQPWDGMLAAAVSMSLVLAALTASMLVMSAMPKINLASTAGTVALGVVALAGVAIAIGVLAKLVDGTKMVEAAVSLTMVLLALSASMAVLTIVGAAGVAAIVGIGILDLFVINLVALLAILGLIADSALLGPISSGLDLLVIIGDKLGTAIGLFVGNVAAGIASGFPKIGKSLSEFWTNAEPFFNGMNALSGSNMLMTVTALCGALLSLTAAELLSGISSFLGLGSMSDFGSKLGEFGGSVKTFAELVSGLDEDSVKKAYYSAQILAKLAETAKEIPNSGGWLGQLVGENDIDDFGRRLALFGAYVSAFVISVSGLTEESVTIAGRSAEILLTMAETANKIPNSGGWFGVLVGNNDIDTFGNQLESFGKSIAKFVESISDVEFGDVSKSDACARILTVLAEAADKIPNSGGWWSKLIGNNDVDTFAAALPAIGTAIAEFSKNVGETDMDALDLAAQAFGKLVEFSANAAEVNSTAMYQFTNALGAISAKGIETFIENFTNADVKVKQAVGTFVTNAKNELTSAKDGLVEVGKFFVEGFVEGLNDPEMIAKVQEAAERIADVVEDGTRGRLDIHSPSVVAWIDGKYWDMGLAEGIEDNEHLPKNAAEAMAAGAVEITEETMSGERAEEITKGFTEEFAEIINDPMIKDKVLANYAEFGYDSTDALEKAIEDGSIDVYNAIKVLANNADIMTFATFAQLKDRILAIEQLMYSTPSFSKTPEQAAKDKTNWYAEYYGNVDKRVNQTLLETNKKAKQYQKDIMRIINETIIDAQGSNLSASAVGDLAMDAVKKMFPELSDAQIQKYINLDDLGDSLTSTVQDMMDTIDNPKTTSPGGKKSAASKITEFVDVCDEKTKDYVKFWQKFNGAEVNGIRETQKNVKWLQSVGVNNLNDLQAYWANVESLTFDGMSEEQKAQMEQIKSLQAYSLQQEGIYAQQIEAMDGYWNNLLEINKNGIESSKYQDMDLNAFKKETLDNVLELYQSYTDKFRNTIDGFMNAGSIFKAVSKQEDVSKEQLRQNLEDQIAQLNEYGKVMARLNERISNEGLKEAISEMGIDSLAELKALNSMTDSELNSYVDLFDKKYGMAKDVASQQLAGTKAETEAKMSELLGGMRVNMDEFTRVFDGTFASISRYAVQFTDVGYQLAAGVGEGLKQGTGEAVDAGKSVIDDTLTGQRDYANINSPSRLFRDEVGVYLAEGVGEGLVSEEAKAYNDAKINEFMTGLMTSFKTILENDQFKEVGDSISKSIMGPFAPDAENSDGETSTGIMTAFVENMLLAFSDAQEQFEEAGYNTATWYITKVKEQIPVAKAQCMLMCSQMVTAINAQRPNFYRAGVNCAQGMIDGIRSKLSDAEGAGREIAEAAYRAAMRALKVHSPSRVMFNIGSYAGEGFVNGLVTWVKAAAEVGTEMAEASVDSVNGAVDDINTLVMDALSGDPTITPVADLSELRKAADEISELFNTAITDVSTNTSEISKSMRNNRNSVNETTRSNSTDETSTSGNIVFQQYNTSPKALSRSEIYRQTRNQLSQFREAVTNQ